MSTNNVRFVDDESTQAHLSVLEAAKQADHSESDMNLIDVMFTGQLTALSGSKKFRRFFDIKQNHWEDFLNTVFATVLWYSTWGNVRDDDLLSDTIRSLCADAFLLNYGTTYWGDEEDRLEFLVEERVRHDDTCLYPQNYTAYVFFYGPLLP